VECVDRQRKNARDPVHRERSKGGKFSWEVVSGKSLEKRKKNEGTLPSSERRKKATEKRRKSWIREKRTIGSRRSDDRVT